MTKFQKKLWMGIGILALLSPIGIMLPEKFKAGDAWGEWGTDTIKEMLGYVPKGLENLSELWKAPLPDYSLGGENAPQAVQYGSYIVSAIVGIVLVGAAWFVLKKTLLKHLQSGQ
jgi:cobalt/nickel transport protein